MAPSRKSPVSPMAAMLSQVHPSPATWVVFERRDNGEFRIYNLGQFITEFRSDNNGFKSEFRARFRTSYAHPYFGQRDFEYTLALLGLAPQETFRRFGWRNQPLDPPTDKDIGRFCGHSGPVRDRRDPYVLWLPRFIVKLQQAHKVLGCTPEEFRRVHLAAFYKLQEFEAEMLFWQDKADACQS